MPSFIKKLHVQKHGSLDFIFTRYYTKEDSRYYILVQDKECNIHGFFMVQEGETWAMDTPYRVPEWIRRIEPDLNRVIGGHR
jgi:hypothetical protein